MTIAPGESDTFLAHAVQQLAEYFAGARDRFDLSLDLLGTPFQLRVWELVQAIPYGQTRSYAALARDLGRPRAARAVGAAVGANPLPIVVPCHRVVGTHGELVGYAGGLACKAWLLAHERATRIVPPDHHHPRSSR
nr:methylated-DNA--[protein]-cysteine S-methyltransferase [Thermomicrobium sp. CFH 73360]